MARSQNTFAKRQREQARREKAQAKAEKRAQRKTEGPNDDLIDTEVVSETPIEPDEVEAEAVKE